MNGAGGILCETYTAVDATAYDQCTTANSEIYVREKSTACGKQATCVMRMKRQQALKNGQVGEVGGHTKEARCHQLVT
jgi:hypothetical protein